MNIRVWFRREELPEELAREADELSGNAFLAGHRLSRPSRIDDDQRYHIDLGLYDARQFVVPEGMTIDQVSISGKVQSKSDRKRGKYVLDSATAYLGMRAYDLGDKYSSGKEIVHEYEVQLTAANAPDAARLYEAVLGGTIWPEEDWDAPQSGPSPEVLTQVIELGWGKLTWLERRVLPSLLRKMRLTVHSEQTEPAASEPQDDPDAVKETAGEAIGDIIEPEVTAAEQAESCETEEDAGVEGGVEPAEGAEDLDR